MKVWKVLPLLAVFWLAAIFPACGAAADDRAARDAVIQAFGNLDKLKTYHMSMEMGASTSISGREFSFSLASDGDVMVKPMVMKMKNTLKMAITPGKPAFNMTMEQYLEEAGDKLAVYTNAGGRWTKQLMPNKQRPNDIERFYKMMKRVSLLSETPEFSVFEVMIGGSEFKEELVDVVSAMSSGKVTKSAVFLQEMPDIRYVLTVDRGTRAISLVEVDLSAALRTLGTSAADADAKMPEAQRQGLRETFASAKLTLRLAFSELNSIEEVRIPAEARQAVLAPAPGTPRQSGQGEPREKAESAVQTVNKPE